MRRDLNLILVVLFMLSANSAWAVDTPALLNKADSLYSVAYSKRNEFFYSNGQKDTGILGEAVRLCKEALSTYEQAYEQDRESPLACYKLGKAYLHVTYIDMSLVQEKKGFKLLDYAAQNGSLDACLFLLNWRKPDPLTSKDKIEEWYTKNRKYADLALGMQLPDNFNNYLALADVARLVANSDLANKYIAKSIDNGESNAINSLLDKQYSFDAMDLVASPQKQFEIANRLWQRGDDTHHDKENGYKLYKRAADSGFSNAEFQMGYILLRGIVSDPDTLKAVDYIRKAAEKGHREALNTMGHCYARGIVVERNPEKSFQAYKKSSDLGHNTAGWHVGLCYYNGFGTQENVKVAREYFNDYLDVYNNAPYMIALTYYKELSPEAIHWFEVALKMEKLPDSQRSDALRKLSACYRFGRCGVNTDIDKADRLLEEAAKYGDRELKDLIDFLKN